MIKTQPIDVDSTTDKRKRHIVERITPKGQIPPCYSDVALCGAKIAGIVFEHNGEICQECVDEQMKR
ncbi:hypothetical protein LCGC14_1636680 [marine sediment metagenome]|uniref:Uncharacterized protein n=1 Tax=marine sediment metagenome TaxID=412755 RepID=A0A0F9I0X0_9ZZZZ